MPKGKKILFLIFFLAFLVRLISLDQSLWLDEATTARVVHKYNFFEIVTKFSPNDFHPPLYYLIMKVWTNMFGYSEIALRMPSILFSLLTGYLVYLLGNKITNNDSGPHSAEASRGKQAGMTKENVGIWSAAFFLFNPLIIYYSHEARMYMMATMFLIASLYYLLAGYLVAGLKNKILFSLYLSLSFLTFYGSIFLIIPIILYLIYKKEFRVLFLLLLLFTLTLLLISPLLFQQLNNAKQQIKLIPNWNLVLGNADSKNLLLIPIKFSIGRISFYPKWFYWGISILWTGIVWFLAVKGGLKNKFLMYLIFGTLGLGIIFSFFTPLLQYFRFLYLIPIISVLIAIGGSTEHLKGVRWIVVSGFVCWSLIYLLNANFHREDWKSLVRNLPNNTKVYMITSTSDPLEYYANNIKILDIRYLEEQKSLDKVLYVIPYTSEIHGIEYRTNLAAKRFSLINENSFRGVTLEKWEKD
ncbi:hypothetical protein A2767_05065 [Candidatus Roizmanbacteria bacterium RIFCSPHIGHO2_01_FULL_35_10]|uniref:Glycosyltransferase RgtA/B/C/D-like domain-containing protein n=1 Tax=Candidatus Roizmanbacteria bacterium RIFCSPLOWO2_01_FULL_35_13 TaxID=1802055 RepID=A0A1F7I6S8_9BACT|nr:MAG: hypothetical protein A2767_05065 [Candidatus Roizmanbacteria bacterium RIFCSPHIGHO2_01_FULL_35_10]OGK39079.1 MAG: hypothetical protein A3A74_05645 [Candidatus Roizmanbacteria bacterium RIFCSPLOWO2_01_FULL_35_13]